ncbi:hypothetical protein LTR93_011770 [Exophiala xenobiotica]|nr:hypothetical protein LTR93_011770 [Exophiala xenobiotica]
MEEGDDCVQIGEDDLWKNVIPFDPFDLAGIAPTAQLTFGKYRQRLMNVSLRLHPDKMRLFYSEDEIAVLSGRPWPQRCHSNLLLNYMKDLSEPDKQKTFSKMKAFWRKHSASTWNADALIAHNPVAVVLKPNSQYYPRPPAGELCPYPTQEEIDNGMVDDLGAWKSEEGRQLFPELKAYSPFNNPQYNLEHSGRTSRDIDHSIDSSLAASPSPGVKRKHSQVRSDHDTRRGRRGAKRPAVSSSHHHQWHPRMEDRPDRPVELERFAPRVLSREQSMADRPFHDETGFFKQVLHPFEYRHTEIKKLPVELVDVFVGTVPAAKGPPAAVYASWATKILTFQVIGRTPSGDKVVLPDTASGRPLRVVPFEEIRLEGGWVGATEDWISFRSWNSQPQSTRIAIAQAQGFPFRLERQFEGVL